MKIGIMDKVNQIKGNIERELPSRAAIASMELANAAVETFRGSRSGKVYRKPGGGRYTASAPGEVPAWRTGQLATHWEPMQSGPGGINPAIQTNVPYAWLDEGSPGGMIAPRPYVKKIVENAMPKIEAVYSEPF